MCNTHHWLRGDRRQSPWAGEHNPWLPVEEKQDGRAPERLCHTQGAIRYQTCCGNG